MIEEEQPQSTSESITQALKAKITQDTGYGFKVECSATYAEPPPMPGELIRGTLHFGRKLLLAAPSHSGKTSLLLALGLAVAQGKPWLGLETERSHVLYVNLEIEGISFIHRIHQLAKAYDFSPTDKRFHFINHRGGNLEPKAFIEELRKKIIDSKLNGIDFRLVIVDPVYKLIGLGGADEDSNRRVSELISGLGALSGLGEVAIAFSVDAQIENPHYQITHEIQNGTGQLARDVDCLLMLWPLHGHSKAYRLKGYMREFESFAPKSLLFDFPQFEENSDLDRIPIVGSAMANLDETEHEDTVVDVWKIWDSFKTREPVALDQFATAMNLTSFEARQKILQAGAHPKQPNLKLRLTMGSKVKAEEDI